MRAGSEVGAATDVEHKVVYMGVVAGLAGSRRGARGEAEHEAT